MRKALLGSFVLIITIIAAIIFYGIVLNKYDDSFNLILFLGIVTFCAAVGVFISGLLIERSKQEVK